MCFTFTKHYEHCGCDFASLEPGNSCGGNCTRHNIRYDEALDENIRVYCTDHKAQAAKLPTSGESEGISVIRVWQ